MKSYEKLGAFYLGRRYDREAGKVLPETILYDAKDLTTHGVCLGMTGSGKTGLCVSLLEEAAIDGIPVLAIDPKGDLGNLMLTFPQLRPADFEPWVDEGEALRKGMTPAQYAARMAGIWKKGLADWDQDGRRIARLREAAEVAIYTPGSQAGLPLGVLRSLAAPPPALLEDQDAMRERVTAAVSGLLALLDVDADPIRSREHILLSNILDHAWREGRNVGIADLIREIQAPPFERVGVLDLESFYGGRDRFELAMRLNNLLASPGFAAWMEGEPLEVPRLLWTPEGLPRISVLSISHLPESQRMFFVTLLLNEVVSWVRTQPGTTTLRAILYMDEVFGYFPPSANPPSKMPMLTLLKQARAYGLGCLLATQNPVDLDYKGLSNAGTWFLGRLQTERDKERVMDGLEGISTTTGQSMDRRELERTISNLGSRVFLMNNVHEDGPVLFHTRWAMSYLRGPLTRGHIQTLMAGRKAAAMKAPTRVTAKGAGEEEAGRERPLLPPGIEVAYLAAEGRVSGPEVLLYRPSLVGEGKLHYVSARNNLDTWRPLALYASLSEEEAQDPWTEAVPFADPDLRDEGDPGARFAALPAAATRKENYTRWQKLLKDHLYRTRSLQLWKCKALKQTSEPGESEGQFRARLAQAARERRDLEVEKLHKKYGTRLERLQERIRKAEQKVEREKSQYSQQKIQTAISVGATLLGALFGRKAVSRSTIGRATTSMRGAGRAARERGDIGRARESVQALAVQLREMEETFEEETARIQERWDVAGLELDAVEIRPRKSDISVGRPALVWTPWKMEPSGLAEPLFEPGGAAG